MLIHTLYSWKLWGLQSVCPRSYNQGKPSRDWLVCPCKSRPLSPAAKHNKHRERSASVSFLWFEVEVEVETRITPSHGNTVVFKQPARGTPGVRVGATKHPPSVSRGGGGLQRYGGGMRHIEAVSRGILFWNTFLYQFRFREELGQVGLLEEHWGCMSFSRRKFVRSSLEFDVPIWLTHTKTHCLWQFSNLWMNLITWLLAIMSYTSEDLGVFII